MIKENPQPLFTGKNILYFPELVSTNEFAMDMLSKTNPPEGTCVLTDYQSGGRGQIGRFWYSTAGNNLLISYIFYPAFLSVRDQFYLNIVSGLAVYDVVTLFCSDVSIKWPNDIYIKDKKVAGILVQNVLRGHAIKATVIGIGLNVNEKNFPDTLPNPTSLYLTSGSILQIADIISLLSVKLEYYYLKLRSGNTAFLKDEYLKKLYRAGILSFFKSDADGIFSATIEGIDDEGRLILRHEDYGVSAWAYRELTFLT
jgi:BirA family biotin operon repressor/biotin-[acetyl-CoA-carboxylase] ligase